jgi:LPS-assembly lipoprotein
MAGLGEKDEIARGDRRRWIAGLAVAAVLVLAGCGWRPLYERPSPDPASGGASASLAKISIDPVVPQSTLDPLNGGSTDQLYDSRAAQLLQNYLKNALNPYGPPSDAVYHLAIRLQQQTRSAVSLDNGQSTREDLIMTAKYELNDAKGQPVLTDAADIVTSYDILREPFSDLSSRRDAQQRAAQELALSIQTRLAVFLKK